MSNTDENDGNINNELKKFSIWEINKEISDRERKISTERQPDGPSLSSQGGNTRSSRRIGIADFTTSDLHEEKRADKK